MRRGRTTVDNFPTTRNAVRNKIDYNEQKDIDGGGMDEGGFPWFAIGSFLLKNVIIPAGKRYLVPWAKKKLGLTGKRRRGRGLLLPGQSRPHGSGLSDVPVTIYNPMTGQFAIPRSRGGGWGGEVDAEALRQYAEQNGEKVVELANSSSNTEEFVQKVLQESGLKKSEVVA